MLRCPWSLAVAAVLLGTPGGPANAATGDAAEHCATIADDRARLACYDDAFGRPAGAGTRPLPAAAAAGATVAGTTSAQAAGAANPQADFGFSEAAKRARAPETAKVSNPDSITSTVTKVARRPTEEMVVTLANGQVWAQLDPETRARIETGDTVTVKRAALGSYLLVTQGGVATRVKRLK